MERVAGEGDLMVATCRVKRKGIRTPAEKTFSVADAKKIENIVDGLIQEVKAENLRLKIQNTTNKVELDILKVQLKKADSEGKEARGKLDAFEGEIIKLQKNEEVLTAKYQGQLDKLQKENEENAAKANEWDDDHGFWQQFNIFKDIFGLIKKLFVISVIGGVLFIAFKIIEIFCPALSILSGIGSMVIGVFKKILPAAFKGAGLVSSTVLDALKHVVASNRDFMKTLSDKDIEDELIANYPDSYSFSKKEVKDLLLALTDKTLAELEKELNSKTDEVTKGVITSVKQEIKGEKPLTSLI